MMNNFIAIRKCEIYDLYEIYDLIAEIYRITSGPDPEGKRVLLKPNVLLDADPSSCITTHPVVVESMIRFMQTKGAEVIVGDSPSIHLPGFTPEKCGIKEVCKRTGVQWVDFRSGSTVKQMNRGTIKVASVFDEVDIVISMPKFKNHELVYFTGAIKNTLGLVPGFIKGKQHALHQDRNRFGEFLVDLCEVALPDYFFMDAIYGMEGPGPANGIPKRIGLLMGSTNPLVMDITASRIAGYEPMIVPTNKTAFFRKKWMKSEDDINYDGPSIEDIKIRNFIKVPVSTINNISFQFIRGRIKFLRKFDRRPVFIHENCTGCLKCVKICPVNAIDLNRSKVNHIDLTDRKCIRCFCCSEVCTDNAVKIKRKVLGV